MMLAVSCFSLCSFNITFSAGDDPSSTQRRITHRPPILVCSMVDHREQSCLKQMFEHV